MIKKILSPLRLLRSQCCRQPWSHCTGRTHVNKGNSQGEQSPQCKGARQSHGSVTWAPKSSRAYFSWVSEPTNLILCLTRCSCIGATEFKGPWWPCLSHNPDWGNISPETSLRYNDLSHFIYAPSFLFLITVISLPDLHIVWVPMQTEPGTSYTAHS